MTSGLWPSVAGLRLLADEPPTLPSVQIVLLVDESGSLSADGVAREKEAARTIALGAVAPDTTVSVVGFGSSDGSAGQTAAITRCPPTRVDSAQSRDTLAHCIDGVHARTPSEGSHTDHVAALRQALGFLSDGTQPAKIVFLLTDGNLDVKDSPAYGRDLGPEARDQAAWDQIPGVLDELRNVGAQVWPLGFGSEVSLEKLKAFEAGVPCTPAAAKPEARVIENLTTLTALTSAIIDAYKSAGCVGGGAIDTKRLPKAGVVDLTVDIPAIASDSAILVYKRNPGIQVEYIDPNNKTASGTESGDSTFEFAGQGTETESLHIVDPVPGRWTVRLKSTSDIPQHEVAATVLFQGAVNAVLTVTPPQPAAGQEVEVAMQVRTRRSAITDAGLLSGLSFQLALTGSSGTTGQDASLIDDDRDGTFTARLRVPENATGSLTFTGTVTGIGIGGDTRVLSTTVRARPPDLQGQLRLTGTDSTVSPGGSVAGEVSIDNKSGRARTLRLQLVDPGPGTVARVSPPVIEVPASGAVKMPFSVEFGTGTLIGGNQALLQAVDDSDTSLVVAQQLIARDVVAPPTFFMRFLWLWIVLVSLAMLGLLVVLTRLQAARRSRTVAGLRLELRRGGMMLHELTPLDANANVFRFVIHDDGFTAPQLQHADHVDENAHEVRRAGSELTLGPAYGSSAVIRPGEACLLRSDLALVVHDARIRSTNGRAAASPAPGGWDAFSGVPGAFGGEVSQPDNPQRKTVTPHAPPGGLSSSPDQPPQSSPGQNGYGSWVDPNNPWPHQ
ncbi:MAG: vWA domain-containing protein [Pseudonocardiaceae bacterium]